MTPTPTVTPTLTPTMIYCGSGVTTGTHYYYDCCGFVRTGVAAGLVVVLDYSKPYNGITVLNILADTICPSPTPTLTQSTTPSNTPTVSITPSLSPTPTITPSNTPYPIPTQIFVPKNECEVFTLFDMGINCYTEKLASSSNSFDGILKILVTGGTPPYDYVWQGGQKTQVIGGLSPGRYGVRVVDFYGDYTATTFCTLLAVTPTPTTTPTMTPTPSSTFICNELCLTVIPSQVTIGGASTYGPWQFICNGTYNGRRTWNYNSEYNIVWSVSRLRWELVENDYITPVFFDGGSIMASTSNSEVPLNLWTFLGNVTNVYTFNMTQGTCPSSLPLNVSVSTRNTKCSGGQNCTGSIIFSPLGGVPPILYSIDNGATYRSSNIFNSLCAGTYITKAKDSTNLVISRQVSILSNTNTVSYNVSVVSLGSLLNQSNNLSTQTSQFAINVSPPIPSGVTLTFTINMGYEIQNMGPWFNNNPSQTADFEVVPMLSKNGADISNQIVSGATSVRTVNRPNCSPLLTEITTKTFTLNLTMTNGDVITGSTYCMLEEINPSVSNGCVSTIESTISVYTTSVLISGCYCCSVVNSNTSVLFNQRVIGALFDG